MRWSSLCGSQIDMLRTSSSASVTPKLELSRPIYIYTTDLAVDTPATRALPFLGHLILFAQQVLNFKTPACEGRGFVNSESGFRASAFQCS